MKKIIIIGLFTLATALAILLVILILPKHDENNGNAEVEKQLPMIQLILNRLLLTDENGEIRRYLSGIETKGLYNKPNTALLIISDYKSKSLFIIENVDNTKRFNLINVDGASGNAALFEAKEISISQGDFILVYAAGSAGLGDMEFYSLESPYELIYSVAGVIDQYHESYPIPPESIAISDLYLDDDGMARYSKIYDHNRLNPEFIDINDDGHTDIILKGIKKTVVEMASNPFSYATTIEEYYCQYIYLYDIESNEFQYSEADSIYQKLYSINDDLANSITCSDLKTVHGEWMVKLALARSDLKTSNADWRVNSAGFNAEDFNAAMMPEEFTDKYITIGPDNISFNDQIYEIVEVSLNSSQDLQQRYNINFADALPLCGGHRSSPCDDLGVEILIFTLNNGSNTMELIIDIYGNPILYVEDGFGVTDKFLLLERAEI